MLHNEATAAIKAINPAIFEGLHIKVGFDFEAPITIKRIPAPFTIKKAWKAVEADNKPSTSTAAIIMRDSAARQVCFRRADSTSQNVEDGKRFFRTFQARREKNRF